MSDSKQLFENSISELAKIFNDKNDLYGDSAFYTGEPGSPFKWWMRFSDVSRKFTRLEQLTQLATIPIHLEEHNGQRKEARDKLIDDYKDLAIYAIIAVIVLEEKK